MYPYNDESRTYQRLPRPAFSPARVRGARTIATALLAVIAAPPIPAANAVIPVEVENTLLRIGPSGIFCVREPCPWRSIGAINEIGEPIGEGTLFSGNDTPDIIAEAQDRKRVEQAWREFSCLLVQGRLNQQKLYVERVIGECPL